MTEINRLKSAINNDKELRQRYLKNLDGLMTDGEITPEMASVAAKKIGFNIPAEEFRKETEDSELSLNDLEGIAGGIMSSNEYAPDGKPVGCLCGYYLTWTDYWIWNNEGLCPKGGVHELDSRYKRKTCKKCSLFLDERGVLECYDKSGNEI
ncbi:MAG: hypothetical protein E7495_08715 [Ruminococcus flavefaciens]|jgi:hypothetical protein|nr:hypothetical protein [Ruminococcus flavefaciens]